MLMRAGTSYLPNRSSPRLHSRNSAACPSQVQYSSSTSLVSVIQYHDRPLALELICHVSTVSLHFGAQRGGKSFEVVWRVQSLPNRVLLLVDLLQIPSTAGFALE